MAFKFNGLRKSSSSRWELAAIIFVALFLVYYSYLLWTNLCDVAGGADSSGYLNFAWRLRHGNLQEPVKALDALGLGEEFSPPFRPIGFSWGVNSRIMVPAYPVGLPLHMVFFAGILGWDIGPYLVSPIAALIGLFLMYCLARQFGLSRSLSLAGAAVLAAFPVYLFMAVQPMSDLLACVWGMATILAGLLARKRSGWAIVAGAAFGMGFLVRPANVLILLALALALPFKPKIYVKFIFGGVCFGIFHLILNHALYGNMFTTGYRGELISQLGTKDLLPRFLFYGRWFIKMLTPLVPIAWLLAVLDRKVVFKDRLLLIFWFLPTLVFYCLYQPFNSWTLVRYFLPALPALILSALFVLREGMDYFKYKIQASRGTSQMPRPPSKKILTALPTVVAGLMLLLVISTEMSQIRRLKLLDVNEFESVYKLSCLSVKKTLPEKSIVLSGQMSGALAYYTGFLPCLWDLLQPQQFSLICQKASQRGYSIYALLFPSEENEFQKNAPGAWEKIENFQFVSLWRLAP